MKNKKERYFNWIEKKLANMIPGDRTYRWFEIKRVKELGIPVKSLEQTIQVLPLP